MAKWLKQDGSQKWHGRRMISYYQVRWSFPFHERNCCVTVDFSLIVTFWTSICNCNTVHVIVCLRLNIKQIKISGLDLQFENQTPKVQVSDAFKFRFSAFKKTSQPAIYPASHTLIYLIPFPSVDEMMASTMVTLHCLRSFDCFENLCLIFIAWFGLILLNM
jgi:hypothetical protein